MGALISTRSAAWSGMRSMIAMKESMPPGFLRGAPFGVPVVPLVRTITRPRRAGGRSPRPRPSGPSPSVIRSARSKAATSVSARRSPNSSSCSTSPIPYACAAAASCAAAKPVFSKTTSAPNWSIASIAITRSRLLRARTATRSPGRTPRASSTRVTRSARSINSAYVRLPDSSTIAMPDGRRPAAPRASPLRPNPQRVSART